MSTPELLHDNALRGVIDSLELHLPSGELPAGVEPLGFGDDVIAFRFEMPGSDVVIKKYHPNTISKLSQTVAAHQEASGIDGLEQLVTSFPEKGIVVTEFAPGKDLFSMSAEEAEQIPAKHLVTLAKVFTTMQEHGLSTDPTPKNFIYDTEAGFTIIDFSLEKDDIKDQSLLEKYTTFISSLGYAPAFDCKNRYYELLPAEFAAIVLRKTDLQMKWYEIFKNQQLDDALRDGLEAAMARLVENSTFLIQDQAEWHED